MKRLAVLAAFATAFCAYSALASTVLLTADPGTGTTTTFTDTGVSSINDPGPVVFDGFTLTGDPRVVAGGPGGTGVYFLLTNGYWTQSWIGTDSPGSITFNLGGSFGFVGGLMNYAPGAGSDATLTALAADGVTVLGTFDLATLAPISTPGAIDGMAFRGIQSSSSDIAYLTLGGDWILAHSLEVGSPAPQVTPEPSSFALLGTAVAAGLGVIRRHLEA